MLLTECVAIFAAGVFFFERLFRESDEEDCPSICKYLLYFSVVFVILLTVIYVIDAIFESIKLVSE